MSADRFDELVVERAIDAPVERVWDAWTTEAGLATWWWTGWDDTTYEIDLRVGGRYRITAESVGIEVSGEFVEVAPPHRLDITWIWEDADGRGPVERVAVDLIDAGSRTVVRIHHSGPWTTADPASDYEQGWNHVLDSLSNTARSDPARSPDG